MNTTPKIKSFAKFYLECTRLKRLYLLSIYSYEFTRLSIKKDCVMLSPNEFEKIQSSSEENTALEIKNLIEDKFDDLKSTGHYKRYKSQARKYLRETILVTLVAYLENYLYSLYCELANILKAQEIYKHNYYENYLGIDRAREGYKDVFNLKFAELSKDYQEMRLLYDVRHLLIHRGGKITEEFVEKYNRKFPNLKTGAKFKVTPEFLLNSMESVKKFSVTLIKEVSKSQGIEYSEINKITSTTF